MIAKAEVLQASIGVSCNEQDLLDCLTDTVAADIHDSSSQLTSSGRVDSGGAHVENIARGTHAALFQDTNERDAAHPGGDAMESGQAAKAEGSVLQEDKPYR